MAKTPKCNLKASAKYEAKAIRRIALKVNRNTMSGILEYLESKDNMQGYILNLVEQDMIRQGIDPRPSEND